MGTVPLYISASKVFVASIQSESALGCILVMSFLISDEEISSGETLCIKDSKVLDIIQYKF